jgi:RimJ/RimL family protein N-acetyltransferase
VFVARTTTARDDHGPPGVNDTATPGAAEIGYTIFAPHRGAGYATEVARAMIDWAAREHAVRHFISGVAPDNGPSLRVNAKLGFVDTGKVVDGERIFELWLSENDRGRPPGAPAA